MSGALARPTAAAARGAGTATASVFLASIVLMALKPLLLHLTRQRGQGLALPPAHFQLAAEATKVTICIVVLLGRTALGLSAPLWRGLAHSAAFVPPAVVYLLMNVLTVRAARQLPPPTFQLLANMKIIFTAVAARLVMGRRLARLQWLALVALTGGVALGQWRGGAGSGGAVAAAATPPLAALLMLLNSGLSALGGVCAERALKSKDSAELSIFATNLHMAVHTLVINGAFLAYQAAAAEGSSAAGTAAAWPSPPGTVEVMAVANEALNGILIGLLMQRIDSIAKNYAFSASIFATAGLSAAVLGHWPGRQFYAGALLTLASMALYARGGTSTTTPGPAPGGAKRD